MYFIPREHILGLDQPRKGMCYSLSVDTCIEIKSETLRDRRWDQVLSKLDLKNGQWLESLFSTWSKTIINNSHKYLKLLDESVRCPRALQAVVSYLLYGCEERPTLVLDSNNACFPCWATSPAATTYNTVLPIGFVGCRLISIFLHYCWASFSDCQLHYSESHWPGGCQ